jgi:hypothetical protein
MIIAASRIPAGNPLDHYSAIGGGFHYRGVFRHTNKLPHVAPAISPWRHSQNLRGQFRFATKQQPQRRLPRLFNR